MVYARWSAGTPCNERGGVWRPGRVDILGRAFRRQRGLIDVEGHRCRRANAHATALCRTCPTATMRGAQERPAVVAVTRTDARTGRQSATQPTDRRRIRWPYRFSRGRARTHARHGAHAHGATPSTVAAGARPPGKTTKTATSPGRGGL